MREPVIKRIATIIDLIFSSKIHFGKNPRNGGMPPSERRRSSMIIKCGEVSMVWLENLIEKLFLIQAVEMSGMEIKM